MTVVIDTNVILVANDQHDSVAPACRAACAARLHAIRSSGRVAIDDGHRILKEYQNKSAPHVGKRAGDAFLKWLLQNKANPERCDIVKLEEHDERGFESFPGDSRLATFDPADRKFVAVSTAHPESPSILQAADSKWLGWAGPLKEHGIIVEFLCPDDIQRFANQKKGVTPAPSGPQKPRRRKT